MDKKTWERVKIQDKKYGTNLTKPELISLISTECLITKAEAERVFATTMAVIFDMLDKGYRIRLPGIGTLWKDKRAARTISAPNGNKVVSPEHYVLKFKTSSAFKDHQMGRKANAENGRGKN